MPIRRTKKKAGLSRSKSKAKASRKKAAPRTSAAKKPTPPIAPPPPPLRQITPPFDTARQQGQAHRERMAQRSREIMDSVAGIGEIPPIANPKRRAACENDLRLFLITYFPHSTGLRPFSADHLRMIDGMQRSIMNGGRRVNAVYRGFAKTTITENAAIWATFSGHCKYFIIFSADKSLSRDVFEVVTKSLS